MIARDGEAEAAPADAPRLIQPTAEELRRERYDSPNIARALQALHQDGFVVLKSVVDPDHVRLLREHMTVEAEDIVKGNKKVYNQGVNSNFLQCPPVTKPELLFDDVFFNPFVIQLMNIYLGTKPSMGFMAGNTALPNTHGMRQPVHKDITFHHPRCPFFAIANLPLCSFSKASGSTEFWLGSHAHTSADDQQKQGSTKIGNSAHRPGEPMTWVLPELAEARRAVRPPVQPEAEPGDFMIRDLRTWHAGMPNETDSYRTMLAFGYKAAWFENHALRIKVPASQANFFIRAGGQPVEVRAEFLEDNADFSSLNDIFDFRPSVEKERWGVEF